MLEGKLRSKEKRNQRARNLLTHECSSVTREIRKRSVRTITRQHRTRISTLQNDNNLRNGMLATCSTLSVEQFAQRRPHSSYPSTAHIRACVSRQGRTTKTKSDLGAADNITRKYFNKPKTIGRARRAIIGLTPAGDTANDVCRLNIFRVTNLELTSYQVPLTW